ncbi:glycosyltransferase family 2 protein [Shouchella shacheensis]|uniref:glycosyltransferase family 2 protein n=1 Tax=Shouchella shacheensis TaxID=1649580 RepID=UPI00073FE90C|nr:glycosyltransferase family A protein [Shouchella shacheensis]
MITRKQTYENELKRLAKKLEEKKDQKEKIVRKKEELELAFNAARAKVEKASNIPRNAKKFVRTTGAYLLGRRNPKQLYSKAYKRKNAENQLKNYKYHLYTLGFTEKALSDLERLYEGTDDRYLKKAIAWELALWHSNKYTQDGARQALEYLSMTIRGEQDADFLRKAVMIAAECLDRLGETDKAKQLIQGRINSTPHPDLYLASANLEVLLEERVKRVNQAMQLYELAPITFSGSTYEDLTTVPSKESVEDGPKVSVIMPAYKAATGIGTAIESILSQTWKNIELLIVDDGSPDNTVDVAKSYAEKDSRIKLLSTPENSGPYVARNIALGEATGEYVTINDADDWSHAEKIETQAQYLRERPSVIANTSEHARLTDELKLHRRGTPGTYIFSNMSSLMFRREPVIEEIGYWDSARFAADSEYKRRMSAAFGSKSIVDLKTGPLSFPRQASGSLTGSSAFGYKGFLMGVRKEYAEVHRLHHQKANSVYYPFPQETRPYPLPEPMWPKREEKPGGIRHFDVVIVSDFRLPKNNHHRTLEEIRAHNEMGLRTGLVQMARYDFQMKKEIDPSIREIMDGNHVQMLVYGEKIRCDVLLIKHPPVLQEKQKYIPDIKANTVRIVVDELPKNVRPCSRNATVYFGKQAKWYPMNGTIRDMLENHQAEWKSIKLTSENWQDEKPYTSRLEDWLV